MKPKPSTRIRWMAMAGVRLAIALLVIGGLWRAANRAVTQIQHEQTALAARIAELDQRIDALHGLDPPAVEQLELQREALWRQRFDWRRIHISWLAGAAALYLAGLLPSAWFWRRVLQALGQSPRPLESLRAYYISHLGKYVPGKALVVVLRAALIRSGRVGAAAAAAAVFIETLTMMASGAALSSLILAASSGRGWLVMLGIALAVAAGAPTIPRWFRRLVQLSGASRAAPQLDQQLRGLTGRVVLQGWCAALIGWMFIGGSMWAVTRALPGRPLTLGQSLGELPVLTACAALAMVAGFLSLLPGGAGVRELVITELLARRPGYGVAAGLCVALLLRLVWLVSELMISTILYVLPGAPDAPSAASTSPPAVANPLTDEPQASR